jgi:hypothetical protein
LILICKCSRGKSTSDSSGSSVGTELEDSSLSLWFTRDSSDILWVFYGGNGSGGHHNLFPGFVEVKDMILGLVTLKITISVFES